MVRSIIAKNVCARKILTVLALLSLWCFPYLVHAEELQFFGDVLLSRGIADLVTREGVAAPLKNTAALFKRDAINIANLEGAIGKKEKCIPSRNPCFAVEMVMLEVLSSFSIISLSNNHSLDLGLEAFQETLSAIKKRGLIPLGGESYSTILRTRDGDIGFVALSDVYNGSEDKKFFIAPDSSAVLNAIKQLKDKTSLVAIYIHWGKELDNLPAERMKWLAKRFVDAGADIVVGHHPHVVGSVDCINGKPIVYSLGNFLFDQKYEETKNGAVLRCSTQNRLICSLIPIKTPMGSFAPTIIRDTSIYKRANKVLASCTSPISPVWSGHFSKETEAKLMLQKSKGLKSEMAKIELRNFLTSRKIVSTPVMPIETLQPVDIDKDGIKEILLIQNIFSSIDNEVAKRVYMYSLDGGLKPLWRGSALSRPLLDAIFIDANDRELPILIALHSADSFLLRDKSKKSCIVMSYRWNGFGFTGIKEKHVTILASRLSYFGGKVRLVDKHSNIVGNFSVDEFR